MEPLGTGAIRTLTASRRDIGNSNMELFCSCDLILQFLLACGVFVHFY